jgi:hypothetical protein
MDDNGKDGNAQDYLLPDVKEFDLFNEGKSPLEVTSELNLPGPRMHRDPYGI